MSKPLSTRSSMIFKHTDSWPNTMTNQQLYLIIGQQTVDNLGMRDSYRDLLLLVQRIKAGTVNPLYIAIDHAAQTWSIKAERDEPDLKIADEASAEV